jgi:hypothetical protein
MNYLLKHFKPIACFLAALILFQSCVMIYSCKPTPVEEVPVYGDTRMKIKTVDGKKHKVRWIEEKDENIVSIKNTIRHFVDTSDINMILVRDSIPIQINFKGDFNREGSFEVRTKKKTYEFMKIELKDQYIIGYEKDGEKTDLVEIPKDQIREIKLEDKPLSGIVTALLYIAVWYGVSAWAVNQGSFY